MLIFGIIKSFIDLMVDKNMDIAVSVEKNTTVTN